MGLSSLMERVRRNPHCSEYYAHGWSFCTPNVLRYTIVAALASFPIEAFLNEVMQDGRIARRFDELQRVLEGEVQYLEALPDVVWQRLACLVDGMTWVALRSGVLHSTYIAVS